MLTKEIQFLHTLSLEGKVNSSLWNTIHHHAGDNESPFVIHIPDIEIQ